METVLSEKRIEDLNIYMILTQAEKAEDETSLREIARSLERDRLLIGAIETGNKQLLQEVAQMKGLEVSGKHYYANPMIEPDPLRTRKNGMVIRNTLCRVAAAKGGVPAICLHLLSEKYALQIEEATTPDYLQEVLSPIMLNEYCDLVAKLSTAKYSNLIKEMVAYIGGHLTEEVSVSVLAEQFQVNASHLARKFKKETGYTITDYVNGQKIEAAKLMFQGGELGVKEVAARLGFNSSSYFSTTFKKIAGISPLYYLQQLKEGHEG